MFETGLRRFGRKARVVDPYNSNPSRITLAVSFQFSTSGLKKWVQKMLLGIGVNVNIVQNWGWRHSSAVNKFYYVARRLRLHFQHLCVGLQDPVASDSGYLHPLLAPFWSNKNVLHINSWKHNHIKIINTSFKMCS